MASEAQYYWYDLSFERVITNLQDDELKAALKKASQVFAENRDEVLKKLPYLSSYRKKAQEAKAWAREHREELLKQLKEAIESLGGKFYFAKTKEEALRIVGEIVGSNKKVIKSKSMTTEELDLNEYLERFNNTVIETDLGERIIQLRKERPSHNVVPAVHLSCERIAELFSSCMGEQIPANATALTRAARKMLRKDFMEADVGISGANAIAADTGTVFIVTNEGNARFVTNAPSVHIVIAGIDKIVRTVEDGFAISMVLPPYGTGQMITSYISLITGPSRTADIELTTVLGVHGPLELHVVIVDNGRSAMAEDPVLYEAFYCVKCGSCYNSCPVYQNVGAAFGHRYFAAIGAVWTYYTAGPEEAAKIAYQCLECGLCTQVCPMELHQSEMVKNLRGKLARQGYVPPPIIQLIKTAKETGSIFGRKES